MSMPIIATPDDPIDREQSVSDLIESVALMETGLSHIINAEGEKIQKVVDPNADYPLEDIINVNNSVERMVNTVSKLEMMLQTKLETSKDLDTGGTPGPEGPPGPPGPAGVTETVYALSTKNSAQLVFPFPTSMTVRIPLETNTYMNGFSASADNLLFTVQNTGDYLVNYAITPIINNGSAEFALNIFVNNIGLDVTTISVSGTVPYERGNSIILHLEEGDTISLGLTNFANPDQITLIENVGARLVLTKIA